VTGKLLAHASAVGSVVTLRPNVPCVHHGTATLVRTIHDLEPSTNQTGSSRRAAGAVHQIVRAAAAAADRRGRETVEVMQHCSSLPGCGGLSRLLLLLRCCTDTTVHGSS